MKMSKYKLLIVGAAIMGAGLFCMLLPNYFLIPLILYTLLVSFGEIINFPFLSTTSMARANNASRGRYMGLTSMSFSLALIISPILGAFLLDNYGFDTLWTVMGIINFIGVLGYFLVKSEFDIPQKVETA